MITCLHKTPTLQEVNSDSRPHVLLIVDLLEKTLGGGERMVIKLASLLPQYGYRVSILAFSVDPESAAFAASTCPIYLLPLDSTYNFKALRAAFDLRRFLREQQVQIVQTFFESSDLWGGLVTKTMSKAKLIWSRRDMGILRTGKHRVAYRLMAGFPNAVFAVSEQVRKHCIEVDRIDPVRVRTIYNGLDLADWNTASRFLQSSSRSVITTAGNIRRVKGHDVFIKAAALVVKQVPEASFNIAGITLDPAYLAELQALIHDLNLANNFHFAGGVTNLREHLAASDIFVLPSRSEGFSNAIVEAMAASLPVVATDVGGNAEAVQDGVSGFIVPPEDPEALAAAILRLLHNPEQAHLMGAAGKKLATLKFTADAMMRQITDTYRNLLARK